jgi:endo-1,4-beta-xylanase
MYKRIIIISILFLILITFTLSIENPLDFSKIFSFEKGSTDNFKPFGSNVKISSVKDISSDGEYSLKVENRISTWDGCEIDFTPYLQPNINYQVSVDIYHEDNSPQPFQIIAFVKDLVGERFDLLGEVIAMPKTWKNISGEFTLSYYGYLEKVSFLIVSPNSEKFIYYIDKFQVLGPNKVEIPGIVVKSNFESGTVENWEPRGTGVSIQVNKDIYHSGNYSLFTMGRIKGWHGAQINISKMLQAGKSYDISVWVYQKSGETQKITLTMQRKYNIDPSTKYDTIVWQKNVPNETWVELTGSYTIPSNVKIEELILYVESPNTNLEFYIDDLRIIDKEVVKKKPEFEIPSLAEIYKDYFRIGVAIPYKVLINPLESKFIIKHFNSITPENEMKPESIQPKEGEFDFTKSDAYIKFAEDNNLTIRGHTLVWHNQTTSWFFIDKDGKQVSKDVLLERLEKHIKTLVGRYKGKIYAWDVVNEAIDPSQPDGYRRSKWFEIIGPEYIEKAFIWAHEADPNAKLFYNDYNTEEVRKRELIYNLVKRLKEKGIPIHGIGIQGHININWPEISEMEKTIQLFSSIPGIEIHVTELDMSVYTQEGIEYKNPPRDILIRQAYRYKQIFDMLKKYKNVVTNVTFWGLKDDYSWLSVTRGRMNYPLLFDKNYQAKLSFWALVDPRVLPPITQQGTIVSGSTIVDGIEDKSYKSAVPIVISDEKRDIAIIKPLWYLSKIYLYGEILDTTKDDSDNLAIYIDQNNAKSSYIQPDDLYIKLYRNGKIESNFSPAVKNFVIRETDKGYVVEVEIQIFSVAISKGSKIGFDFSIKDKDRIISWSDTSNQQTMNTVRYGTLTLEEAVKLASAKKGTPVIDAEMDELYKDTEEISTGTVVMGSLAGAKAKARMLWDEDHIYVYAIITDPILDDRSSNPWEQDSLEIFIDENNAKTSSYQSDDAQYRVNYKNVQTFGTGASKENIVSATKILKDGDKIVGYVVELGIKMKSIKLSKGIIIGFDIQVNDGTDGTRVNILTWNDPFGNNWRDTSKFGNLELQ